VVAVVNGNDDLVLFADVVSFQGTAFTWIWKK
jgi:hypothetical protein